MTLVPRKRLDLSFADLVAAAGYALRPGGGGDEAAVERAFSTEHAAVACLSVRTGFDLVLSALALQPGDEIVVSAFNIPHMAELIRRHGAVPVPIDLDPTTMSPDWGQVERAIGPRTRAVLIAHLFGARLDLSAGVALARDRGLVFIEDAAQAFDTGRWRGHEGAHVTLFSFGSIKTATALGSAVAVVRDGALATQLRARNAALPRRSRASFLVKVGRYALLLGLTRPGVYGAAAALADATGVDFDAAINAATRSFRGVDLLDAIRARPSRAQLALLRRRLSSPESSGARRRAAVGRRVAAALPPGLWLVGGAHADHCHWLFPVSSAAPDLLVARLRDAGFDATRGGTTLSPVRQGDARAPQVEAVFRSIVYLPVDSHLSDQGVAALLDTLAQLSPPEAERAPLHLHGPRASGGSQTW